MHSIECSRSKKKYDYGYCYGYGSVGDNGISGGCKVPKMMEAAATTLLVLVAITVRTCIIY